MLNRYARATATRILTPVAKLLLRLGVSPDVVTVMDPFHVAALAGQNLDECRQRSSN